MQGREVLDHRHVTHSRTMISRSSSMICTSVLPDAMFVRRCSRETITPAD
jgi:hypothetical protein